MEKRTIYVFSTAYYPFVGGAEIAIQEVARRLAGHFDFVIVTARMRRGLPKREVRPEGTIVRVGFGTRFDKWLLPLFVLFRIPNAAFRAAAKERNILMWGMDISQGTFAATILKVFFPRIPFVFTLQYGYGDERIQKGRGGMIRRSLSFFLSRADHVTAISSYLCDVATTYGYDGPVTLIPNGVDSRFERPPRLEAFGKKVVITTSRLVPKNGIDILIRSFLLVLKREPDAVCWILGDGPERRALEELTESLGISESVRFFGDVPYEKIPKYLWEATVFVRPSRSEGMGNSFVEALAAGLPIIGTPVGGVLDIIADEKTGLFAKEENAEDLAEKILRLIDDQALSSRIKKEGLRMVEKRFGWDLLARAYEDVFSRLYEERPLFILIASPLSPPRVGGPALYASALPREFRSLGHRAGVVSFDSFLRFPTGVRHVLYFFSLWRKGFRRDILFSLDHVSVGLPAFLVSFLFRVPIVFRVEGDFLWESYVERTHRDITLRAFYHTRPKLSPKEQMVFSISRAILRRASRLVCSSEWRAGIVAKAYGISKESIEILSNAYSVVGDERYKEKKKNIILWAGRALYLKNLYRLVNAFQALAPKGWELHLVGDGPDRKRIEEYISTFSGAPIRWMGSVKRELLFRQMAESSIFILPSLSDVGPNVILEALAEGTAVILTRESGYRDLLKDAALFVDPLDERDIRQALERYIGERSLRDLHKEMGKRIASSREWPDVAAEWASLFKSLRK